MSNFCSPNVAQAKSTYLYTALSVVHLATVHSLTYFNCTCYHRFEVGRSPTVRMERVGWQVAFQRSGLSLGLPLITEETAPGKGFGSMLRPQQKLKQKKLLSEFEYNQQRNILVQSTKMTFFEFLEHWMENYVKYNCEDTTTYGYNNIIYKHIVPFLGNFELQKLQPVFIQHTPKTVITGYA